MAMSELESGAELVKAWGELSDSALLGLTILGIGIVVAVILYLVFKYKRDRIVEDNKNKRANIYASGFKALEEKMQRGDDKVNRMICDSNKNLSDNLHDINENLAQLIREIAILRSSNHNDQKNIDFVVNKVSEIEKQVDGVLANTVGMMNETDSALLTKIYFYKVIQDECEKIVRKSLKENDFKSRSEFVCKKVKTEIGNVLSDARSILSGLPLSINISILFKIDSKSTSERFMLVDMIWDGIEDLFLKEISLEEKYEEASLRVLNIIRDYITEIFNRELDTISYQRINSEFH